MRTEGVGLKADLQGDRCVGLSRRDVLPSNAFPASTRTPYSATSHQIARSALQLGAAVRRKRRQLGLSQGELGSRIQLRQATISKLEAGGPATRLQTLLDVLAALDLELVVRARTKSSAAELEDVF